MSAAPPEPYSFESLSARHGARYPWLVLLVAGLGVMSSLLASTSFTVAVPALIARFGVGPSQVQWTITGFMAAMTVGMLPTSWLLDHLGFRRLFLGASALMALAGIAGSLAPNFAMVVALRALQGAAAGILQPLATIAVMRLFPPDRQGRAMGLLGFGIVLAPALAPTLAGMLLDHFGWAAIFLLNLPVCLLAMAFGARLLPRRRPAEQRGFDWLGLALLTLATLSVVEAVANLERHGPTGAWTLLFASLAAAGWVGYVLHARRASHPIIGLAPFADRNFSLGAVVTFTYGFGLYASAYLIPVFLQHAMHFSATAAGVALLPSGIVLALTIPLAGRMADRVAAQLVTLAGLVAFCLSFVFFGLVADHIRYAEIIGGTVLGRIGLGLILPALSIATLRQLPNELIAQSSVVVAYLRQLGGVMGVAVAAVFVAWREAAYQGQPSAVVDAYADGYFMVAGVFLLAIVAASFMTRGSGAERPRIT